MQTLTKVWRKPNNLSGRVLFFRVCYDRGRAETHGADLIPQVVSGSTADSFVQSCNFIYFSHMEVKNMFINLQPIIIRLPKGGFQCKSAELYKFVVNPGAKYTWWNQIVLHQFNVVFASPNPIDHLCPVALD